MKKHYFFNSKKFKFAKITQKKLKFAENVSFCMILSLPKKNVNFFAFLLFCYFACI